MKADLYNSKGEKQKQITLPSQFNEPIRPDLIHRAVLVVQASKRSSYGAFKEAGQRASAKISKRRRKYRGSYGRGGSRIPRKVMWRRGTQFGYEAAFAPGTKGGRRSHPPKSEKDFTQKINIKERRKAIRSALAATTNIELVKARGHKLKTLPLTITSDIEKLSQSKQIKELLIKLGLKDELARLSIKKIRAGKGKTRGRKYRTKTGPLIVVSKSCPLQKAVSNLKGIKTCIIKNINAELLAPGTVPGRLTIYTEDSLKILDKEKLFMEKNGTVSSS